MARKMKSPPVEGETAPEKGAASAAKKSAAKKSVVKRIAPKKIPAKKAAAKNAEPARKKTAPRTISGAERSARIAEAAFLRAESLGFAGDPHDHWMHAEAEVDARLRKSRVKLVD